ncbi:glycoside hydrolase family 48 protein [Labedaea rhizosphaerae]|uniref:Chitodextrinase n=1 Tax=Labedaea rhizosphaerae TaxID=598644 RepID=A0A4R6SDL2_LABRH|nr:glycoside hydrolase family 48 protein [Labedaea rhizosphaerae]TDP97774.1 chitodextrinase [Labedaea rhizosphaerae]
MTRLNRRRFVTAVGGALLGLATASEVAKAEPRTLGRTQTTTATATAATSNAAADEYEQRFLDQYNKIKDPANGYFSSAGVPYHSVEKLMVEAPDHGHQSTSEAFSYWMWLEATYGRVTGDWAPFNSAWSAAEKYIIPTHTDQPSNDSYNASKPATYAPEWSSPNNYPSPLDSSVAVGSDPIAGELKSAYGTSDVYGMHWLIDVDNVYGYGNTAGTGGEAGPSAPGPCYINSYQRGAQESVWETIPQPCTDQFKYGGPNGYLDLFVKDQSYAKQWKYTNAPDADARAIQAAYWAQRWATAQGNGSAISASVAKAARMGDFLRYAMFDKYFKRVGNCVDANVCPAGNGREAQHYLLGWYYAWGGAEPGGGWAWRIGDGASHTGYQNPVAAFALSSVSPLVPKGSTAQSDWSKSLGRQIEFLRWLQSAEGGIAGGCTNSWDGQYGTPPAGTPTFYGMAYDWEPVYHDPPSNNWFGMQAWGMERWAEYYYITGDSKVRPVLDKWVAWVSGQVTADPAAGTFKIPSTLAWTGQPDTWNPASPGSNTGLHVSVTDYSQDVGVAAATVKALLYYAAATNDTAAKAKAKNLLDAMSAHAESKGVTTVETREDYKRFGDQVYVPSGWSGTMPNGDKVQPGVTFIGMRSFYKTDPRWPDVQAYVNGTGPAPKFTYHRFWAQADVAMAFAVYSELFGGGGGGGDTQPPTTPTGVTVTATTSDSVSLSWSASTDNVGVAGYLVQRNGIQVGSVATTGFTDTGLAAGTAYSYTVRARDAAGNLSTASSAVTGTTKPGSTGGSVTASYHVDNDWGNGFTATITVQNKGTTAISAWEVKWTWGGNQQVTNSWNAGLVQNGTGVDVHNLGYNGSIAPGQSTTFGIQATYSGSNPAPTLSASGS